MGGPSKLLASAQAVKKSEGYKTKPMQEPKPGKEHSRYIYVRMYMCVSY